MSDTAVRVKMCTSGLTEVRRIQANGWVANDSFSRSMSLTKDYWHLAEYPALLRVYQKAIHDAVTGRASPDQALDRCAREQDGILRAGQAAHHVRENRSGDEADTPERLAPTGFLEHHLSRPQSKQQVQRYEAQHDEPDDEPEKGSSRASYGKRHGTTRLLHRC